MPAGSVPGGSCRSGSARPTDRVHATLDRSDLHTAVHLPPRTVRTPRAVEGAEKPAYYEMREDIARPMRARPTQSPLKCQRFAA
jgi:hypothetical protein